MYRIYRAREKEGRSRQKHKKFQIEKNILPEDGGGESQLMAQPVQKAVTRYERKVENYVGLVQFHAVSYIYRKIFGVGSKYINFMYSKIQRLNKKLVLI